MALGPGDGIDGIDDMCDPVLVLWGYPGYFFPQNSQGQNPAAWMKATTVVRVLAAVVLVLAAAVMTASSRWRSNSTEEPYEPYLPLAQELDALAKLVGGPPGWTPDSLRSKFTKRELEAALDQADRL